MSRKISAKSDPTLNLIAQNLRSKMKLKRLYLYGSRARGDHYSESDYDLIAIVENSRQSKLERSAKARAAIGSVGAAIDIIVLTQREFDEAAEESGTLAETVFLEGQEIDLG